MPRLSPIIWSVAIGFAAACLLIYGRAVPRETPIRETNLPTPGAAWWWN